MSNQAKTPQKLNTLPRKPIAGELIAYIRLTDLYEFEEDKWVGDDIMAPDTDDTPATTNGRKRVKSYIE